MNPVEVSFLRDPMPSGTPTSANARHASENDCLDVTALVSLALFLSEISGLVARYAVISELVMEEAFMRRFFLLSKENMTGSTSATLMGVLVPLESFAKMNESFSFSLIWLVSMSTWMSADSA